MGKNILTTGTPSEKSIFYLNNRKFRLEKEGKKEYYVREEVIVKFL